MAGPPFSDKCSILQYIQFHALTNQGVFVSTILFSMSFSDDCR